MRRRQYIGVTSAALAGLFISRSPFVQAGVAESASFPRLNPYTQWLRDAKWGLFSHLTSSGSSQGGARPDAAEWVRKVDSFNIRELADQLEALKVRYYFLTIGTDDHCFCAPNKAFEKHFGAACGVLSGRDLIRELAAELKSRGIRMCASLPALGAQESREIQEKYLEVISEWSLRWGKAIDAWWVDDGQLSDEAAYAAYTDAFKAGNPNALIAFNTGPLVLTYNLKEPATKREDFFAGQVDWYLPTCAVRAFDKKEFWVGPDFCGAQLHFLSFLGSYWGAGEPRFPDDLVKGWTKHTNNYSGTVTWDVPLTESGTIPGKHYKQISELSKFIVV